ncbi:restriction endonuclease subunit S [Halobaculum litoreum]|uniref:Restriction endonuclease subunit S n=1 Tax=Halobaculum litoreum TaxID=3031998 RepID=A0ABD5XQ85_9EURY|nr:restriction endonuclease subunit S [Halobaculum sp. DT92]
MTIETTTVGEEDAPVTSIPSDWSLVPLKYACEINPDSVTGEFDQNDKIKYIDISSVSDRGEITFDEEITFGEAPSRAKRLVCHGDTIVSTVRTYLRAIAYIDEPTENTVVSSGFAVLRPQQNVLPQYLSYCIRANPYIEWIVANSTGVSYPAIGSADLGNLKIPVPPLPVQADISRYIKKKSSGIFESIDYLDELKLLLDEYKKSLITNEVVSGVHQDRSFFNVDSEWYDQIPYGWELKRLNHLRKSHTPIVYGIIKPGPNRDEGVPIIKGGDCKPERLDPELLSKTTEQKSNQYSRSELDAGDLVYEIRGSVGRVVKIPPELEGANLTQDTARISPKEHIDPDWLQYALQSEPFRQQMDLVSRGATVQGVNLYDLRRGIIPVPPEDEQTMIARSLDSKIDQLSQVSKNIESIRELLSEKRQALITAAVTGQIDVSEERGDMQDQPV